MYSHALHALHTVPHALHTVPRILHTVPRTSHIIRRAPRTIHNSLLQSAPAMKFIVFDTETTGLPKKRNADPKETHLFPYIVQISWLVFDTSSDEIITLRDEIVRLPDGVEIPESATKIHGITQEKMLTDGKNVDGVLREFLHDVDSCTYLVAHNIDFDKTLVEVECIRNGVPKSLLAYSKMEYCTMKQSKSFCKLVKYNAYFKKNMLKYPKLVELHQKLFNSVPKNLHNSLIDVLVCCRCFYSLVFAIDMVETNVEFKQHFTQHCGL